MFTAITTDLKVVQKPKNIFLSAVALKVKGSSEKSKDQNGFFVLEFDTGKGKVF